MCNEPHSRCRWVLNLLTDRTVRSAKLASSKKGFAIYGDAVEIVVVDDLVKDVVPHIFEGKLTYISLVPSLSAHLVLGVDALIHTAQPLPGRATAEESLNVRQLFPLL